MPSRRLVEHSWPGTAQLWHGSHKSPSVLLRAEFFTVALKSLGNTGYRGNRTAERYKRRLHWITWSIANGNCKWKKSWISFWNRRKRNRTTRPDQTSKIIQSWFRRLEWCDLHKTENSLDTRSQNGLYIEVSQDKAIDELEEIPVERNTKEDLHCTPSMHTMYRSLLGQINWLQSRTQFQCCHKICRGASMAASPTIDDVKSLNTLARQIKSLPVKLQYWPLTGPLRILGFPDASYRNNDDGSSQRSMTVFFAVTRERSSRDGMA